MNCLIRCCAATLILSGCSTEEPVPVEPEPEEVVSIPDAPVLPPPESVSIPDFLVPDQSAPSGGTAADESPPETVSAPEMEAEPEPDTSVAGSDGNSSAATPGTASLPGASAQTNLLLSQMPELAEELEPEAETTPIVPFDKPSQVALETGSPPTPAAAERFYLALENETQPALALQRIDSFVAFYDLTEAQSELIGQQREVWEAREREQFVKSGEHFVPAHEMHQEKERFHQDLSEVIQLAESGQPPEAVVAALDRISEEYDDTVMSYFVSGLVKAIWLNESRDALADFRRVLREVPDHAGALNNIAICEMKTGDYGRALGNWRKAVEGNQLAVSRAEILHNIRYAHQLASSAKTKMPTSFADAAARLLSESAGELDGRKETLTGFWRFSSWVARPALVVNIRTGSQTGVSTASVQRPVETTYGISLGRDLILVAEENLHLPYLGRSQHLRVHGNNVRATSRSAVCRNVATNDELGLTLLECPDLAAPVLSLASGLPAEADPVYVAGENVRSAIEFSAGSPEKLSEEVACLFAAVMLEAEQSRVGMPVFDGGGNLAGLLSPLVSSRGGREVRYAWSAPTLRTFIKSSPVEPLAWPLVTEEGDWESRKQILADHVVEIKLCYPEETLSLNRAARSKFNRSHYLADHSCFVCSGRSYLGCDQKGCANGSVSSKYREIVSRTIKGEPVYGTKIRTSRCPRCSGTGKLRCPNCSDGVEPRYGGRPSGFADPRGFLSR